MSRIVPVLNKNFLIKDLELQNISRSRHLEKSIWYFVAVREVVGIKGSPEEIESGVAFGA
jgi:hypothetical protein